METKTWFCRVAIGGPLSTLLLVLLSAGFERVTKAAPPPSQVYKLSINSQGANAVIDWVGQAAQLEAAKDLSTPSWVVIPGAVSPFLPTPDEVSRFYRLRLPPAPPNAKLIRGYIVVNIPGKSGAVTTNAHDVYLPGVEVYLRNVSSGDVGISTLTDLSGRFTLPATEGRYRICWQAPGFASDCSGPIYSIGGNINVHVGKVAIPAGGGADTTVVYGKVRMKDNSSPRLLEPLANINAFARVELLDKDGESLHEAYVNNFGEYLLPAVPSHEKITLRVKSEAAASDQPIFPEANLAGSPFQPIDLVLGNSPPRLEDLFAADPTTGRWLKTLRLGRTAKLTARATDPDGDSVKFRWVVQAGSGDLNAATGPEVIWTPPNTQGLYSVTVIAYDNKGGYARSTYPLRVDNAGVPFSGKVDATDAPAGVSGAQIEVNGQITSTGPDGSFYLRVIDATRFVLNIRKTGYGLVSQIYDRNITGGDWTLARATVTSQDPTQDIDVRDQRDERNCTGPFACQLNWQDFPNLAQPQWQDGSNNIVPPFGKLEVPVPGLGECPSNKFCGPGIRVQIPANSLEDQNGQPPTGNVNIQLFTIDLNSPFQMPGDYTVRTSSGDTQVMESYGAGIVEITAGSRRYNLKSGATAQLTIPVDPSQLATGNPIPPTIPILFYNETQGVWLEEGSATLAGNVYLATVPHFSAINTDQIKQNQSCVRIKSPTLPNNYNLEYFVPRPGMAPKHDTVFIDNSVNKTHVIYNLPSGVNIILVPIRLDNNTPIGTFVVNTGGPQNPTTPNLPSDPPIYAACSTEVTLTDQAIPDLPNTGEFLHGLFSFEAVNLTELTNGGPDDNPVLAAAVDQATANYYQHIDPLNQRVNLNDFITANGFGPGEINIVYANSADLGFGRNMHGIVNGLNTAAYVSNFGDIDSDDQTDADEAAANLDPVATVAMEYSPIEGDPSGDRVVKFYVYNNLGQRVKSANLDKLGNRPVPQLCMVCHGGEYPGGPVVGSAAPFNSVADVKLGAKFLPFDLHYYKFPATKSKASQQLAFKQFNQDIVNVSPADPVIGEVITEMYAGFSQVDPNVQDEDFVVNGWRDAAKPVQESMYRDVVSRSCRTCHEASPFPKLNFREASDFLATDGEGNAKLAAAEIRVGDQHVMPHSKVTHKLFWTSINLHQPAVFQLFGDTFGGGLGWNGTLLGNYTPGGTTPVTDFTTKVQPIFTSKCAVCHAGGSPPPQCKPLNLSSGSAHANIVSVTAGELPAMNRITPNNPNQSYLWFKINGTQGGLPGLNNACDPSGNSKMPLGGSLNATEINDITSWINTGAGL